MGISAGGGKSGHGENQEKAAPDVRTEVTAACIKGGAGGDGDKRRDPGCIWQEGCSRSHEAELESNPSSCGEEGGQHSDPRTLPLSLCKGESAHAPFLSLSTGSGGYYNLRVVKNLFLVQG